MYAKLEAYMEEMASADHISGSVNIQKIQDDVVKLWNVVKSQPEISKKQSNPIKALYDGVIHWSYVTYIQGPWSVFTSAG
jgi:fatty acid synthase subunit alpha, fungi type